MEDITHRDSKRLCERSPSVPASRDVEHIGTTSVKLTPPEYDSLTSDIYELEPFVSVSSYTEDVMADTDRTRRSSSAGNRSSKSNETYRTSVGNSANQPAVASVCSSQLEESPVPVTSGLESVKQLSPSETARRLSPSETINPSSEPLHEPTSITSSQGSVKASGSNLNQHLASSLYEMEACRQCVICQEILHTSTRDLLSSELISHSSEQHQSSAVPTSVASAQGNVKASTSNVSEPPASSWDEIGESLQCVICQEVLYKCVRSVLCNTIQLVFFNPRRRN